MDLVIRVKEIKGRCGVYKVGDTFKLRKEQRKILTCVSAINRRALIYYVKHGFTPEGYCRDHFIPDVDEIILGRFL